MTTDVKLMGEIVRTVFTSDEGYDALEMNRIMEERGNSRKAIQDAIRLALDMGMISLGSRFKLVKPPANPMNVICEDCGARMGDHRIGGGSYHPQPLRPEAEKRDQDWLHYNNAAQEFGYPDAFRNALNRARQEERDAIVEIIKDAKLTAEKALLEEQNCCDQDVTYMVELQHAACAEYCTVILNKINERSQTE